MDVTRERLAKALDHLWVYASNREAGTQHAQITEVPGGSLDTLMEELAEQPDDTNVLGMDHVCEHPIGDREVQLMVDILRGMAGLDDEARQRIRNWVDERFVPRRLSPF